MVTKAGLGVLCRLEIHNFKHHKFEIGVIREFINFIFIFKEGCYIIESSLVEVCLQNFYVVNCVCRESLWLQTYSEQFYIVHLWIMAVCGCICTCELEL